MIAAIMTSFIVSTGLSLLLTNSRGRWQILDIPNERSLHDQPIPRTGGIAILTGLAAGLLTAWCLDGQQLVTWPTLLSVCLLAGIALVDDRHTLGAGPRLLIQIGAVSILLFTREVPSPGILTLVVVGLFLVWMINLYNFMDGMDGFAGGMSVIGFTSFALLAWQAGNMEFALGCAVIVAATAGFLLLNFPPARLFMGDTGSTVLGLLAGVVILSAHSSGVMPVWLGILVFSPFIVDASMTLAHRLLRGERIWEAHKTHYYQMLVQTGWGHRRTVLAEYVLMLACGTSALFAAPLSSRWQTSIIAVWAVVYVILMVLIHRAEASRDS